MAANDTTSYEIVARAGGTWSPDGIGDANEFPTIEGAEAAIESLIALGDEWRVGTYSVREIGSDTRERGSDTEGPDEICDYCERQVSRQPVPRRGAPAAQWDEIATEHAADCEWVITRAFNRH